ncbi:MAG: GAF domain-containing sensor histidine kinase [Nitrospinae bacterium]|nr:GAF domain-containing sensor histidine kinase [Nitrospinota bacterium]
MAAKRGSDGREEYAVSLERRLKTLETVARIGAIITSRLTLKELTQAVVEHLGQVLRSDRVNLVLYDKKERTLAFIASFFSGENKRDGAEVYPLSDGMNSWIVKNQKPLLITRDSIEECERMGIRHGGKPAKSWLGVPMFHKEEVLGVLSVQAYDEPGVYDDSSVELLSLVATQVAVAVVNAELYETMEKREKEKQRLYYSLTHDLLSFVSPMDGYAEMLRRAKAEELAERKDDIAKSIKNGVKKISRFVEDILFYSKLESGKMDLHASPANIYPIITLSASNFFSELALRKLALYVDGKKCDVAEVDLLGGVPLDVAAANVLCDQIQIERVLNNCIHNAVKHARSRIDVRVGRRDGEILCTVSDDGDGMPEELAPKVFDEYFQAQNGKKGVGLGLPSVKRIVEQHGGKVWVETAKGRGFSFTFTLPAA